jgi:Leucine-rich repeat (LRR) protein
MVKRSIFGLWTIVILLVSGCTVYTSRVAMGEKGIKKDHKGLKEIPEDVFTDTTIRSLSLFGNQLTDLPAEFSSFNHLEVLYLGKNEFTAFPEEICALKSLRILSLAYNSIDSLPDCLCEMENLEWLLLNNNQLVELPDSIGKLKKLQQLNLKRNLLKKLPEQLYAATSLQFLDLSYNELQEIDSALGNLHQLRELRLYRSGFLIQVPESVCSLRFLELLNIDPTVVLPTCIFARKTNRLVIQSTDL